MPSDDRSANHYEGGLENLNLFESNTPTEERGFKTPREFQVTTHDELRKGFAKHRLQLVMAPTGGGKTYIALRVCAGALAKGKRVVFICDRKTLINQTSETADSYGMPPHGIIQANNPRFDLRKPFQIASAQTIQSRGINDVFDVIVVDEAHTVMDATVEFIQASKAAVIGLSATPFTKGLGKIYGRVINAATMEQLTKQGVLTPLRVLTCTRPDMTGAKTSGGEWTQKAAEERELTIIGDVVKEWQKHAAGLKTIVFGPTIAHCEKLVEQFKAAGVEARAFTSLTTDSERAELLAEYRKPDSRLRVLVSVEALAKGFDVPDVGCVCDCRPLRKSLSTFVQMVGRGLRCSPGKTECVLLDFSGNVIRFAEDFADVYFNGLASLDEGERLDREVRDEPKEPKACGACGFTPCGKKCIRCGFEAKRKSEIEHGDGEAVEVDILKARSGERYAGSKSELYAAIATYARRHIRGNAKGWTAHKYRGITGGWPGSFNFDREGAFAVEPSPALVGKLMSMDIAWRRSASGR